MDGKKGERKLKGKVDSKVMDAVKTIAIGEGVACMTLLSVIALVAVLISNGTIQEGMDSYGVWAALTLSTLAGALVCLWGNRETALLRTGVFGAIYLVVLLVLNAILFDGRYAGVGVEAILIMGISLAMGLVRFVRKGQPGYYRFRYKNRPVV